MRRIRCTLGGVPLQLADGQAHAWSQTHGVNPFSRVFYLSGHRAKKVMARAIKQYQSAERRGTYVPGSPQPNGPLTFMLDGQNGMPAVKVRGLYAVQLLPGLDTNSIGVLVVDRRWLWSRVQIDRSYNMRRKTAEVRLLSGALVPAQVAQRTPDYDYRRQSLKDQARPWTAQEVLEDVLTALCGPGSYRIDTTITLSRPPDQVVLHDAGPQALARVLGYMPGISVYPGDDGLIHVTNTRDGSEIAMANLAHARLYPGTGTWRKVDLSLVRPSRVPIGFERELEARWDYRTYGTNETRPRQTPGREDLVIDNVIPVVDEFLDVNGKRHHYGTYLPIDDWIAGVVAKGDLHSSLPQLSDALIRRWFLAGFSFLHHVASFDAGGAPNPVWARRLNALQEHWRRTFRILPQWMDKIRSIRAYRVAVIDQETGTRARADAYFDHTVKPSFKTLYKRGGQALGFEVTGYAEDLGNARPSPAEVEVIDSDVGIVRITPRVDMYGVGTVIAPGHLDGPMPSADAASSTLLWNQVALKESWRCSFVLTIVPDAPNNEQRLWWESVTPEEADELLPGPSLGACNGPEWATFAGVETARFAWIDADGPEIKESVWTGKVNYTKARGRMVNPDTVKGSAQAQAARVYHSLADHAQGHFKAGMNAKLKPTGNLQTLTHGIIRQGNNYTCFSELDMPPRSVDDDVYALMPDSVRQILLKEIQR